MADMSSLENKLRKRAAEKVAIASVLTLEKKRADAPKKTGKLRGSGRVGGIRVLGNVYSTSIEFTEPQASFTQDGTKPHDITARGFGAMKFYWLKAGEVIEATTVHHPGSKKHRGWFTKGLQETWRNSLRRA